MSSLCSDRYCSAALPWRDQPPKAEITRGVAAVLLAENDKTDGILSVAESNLYVQCLDSHFLPEWRCESAGIEGQPWLQHVLTTAAQAKLAGLGFAPDPETGNFIALLPKATAPDLLAGTILQVLTEIYGAKPKEIGVKAEKLRSAHCHRRIKAGHDRGRAILTKTIGFKQDAEKNCKLTGHPDGTETDDGSDEGSTTAVAAPGMDVDARYLTPAAAELDRLRMAGPHAYVIFEAKPACVQCKHDAGGKRMYCQAASADVVGKQVARILTPERQAKLIATGFAPRPGHALQPLLSRRRIQHAAAGQGAAAHPAGGLRLPGHPGNDGQHRGGRQTPADALIQFAGLYFSTKATAAFSIWMRVASRDR